MALYYTETPAGPRFQIRLPHDLVAHLAFSCLSVPLDPAPKLILRRRALSLAGAAHQMFVELRGMSSDELSNLTRTELKARLEDHPAPDVPCYPEDATGEERRAWRNAQNDFFNTARELLNRPEPVQSLADRTIRYPIKGLVALQARRDAGGHLVDATFDEGLERLFQRAMSDRNLQRLMVGLPAETSPAEDRTPQIDTYQQSGGSDEISDQPKRPGETRGSLDAVLHDGHIAHPISAAFAEYRADLIARKGPANENVANLDSRAAMFHALCGDPDIRELTNQQFKSFAYAISYLPASIARDGSWSPETLKGILVANGYVDRAIPEQKNAPSQVKLTPIGEQTWKAKTVSVIKTAIKQYAGAHGLPLVLQDFVLHLPSHTPPATSRSKPAALLVDEALQRGLSDGRLVQAMLPLLGALTGRRISLLAHLRAEQFEEQNGHWLASVDTHYISDGVQRATPIKNSNSSSQFVLHDVLTKIGFIDYVKNIGSGWVFPSLQVEGIIDPGNVAQKRLAHVINPSGNSATTKSIVFHQLRHFAIGEMRNAGISPELRRRQVGQAAEGVHEKYAAGFEPAEIELLATRSIANLPNIENYRRFEFEAAARQCLAAAQKQQRVRAKSGEND